MAAMRMAGVRKVAYAYGNEDGAPFGLSTAAVYEDLAKPFAEQSMAICHRPVRMPDHPDLYAEWAQARRARLLLVDDSHRLTAHVQASADAFARLLQSI